MNGLFENGGGVNLGLHYRDVRDVYRLIYRVMRVTIKVLVFSQRDVRRGLCSYS